MGTQMTPGLDWLISVISVAAIYLNGRKIWWGWLLSMLVVILLVIVNLELHLYGFLPLNAVCLALYVKNCRAWYREVHK